MSRNPLSRFKCFKSLEDGRQIGRSGVERLPHRQNVRSKPGSLGQLQLKQKPRIADFKLKRQVVKLSSSLKRRKDNDHCGRY
jgi:hypothetical protein